jgi:hypothetical protein
MPTAMACRTTTRALPAAQQADTAYVEGAYNYQVSIKIRCIRSRQQVHRVASIFEDRGGDVSKLAH